MSFFIGKSRKQRIDTCLTAVYRVVEVLLSFICLIILRFIMWVISYGFALNTALKVEITRGTPLNSASAQVMPFKVVLVADSLANMNFFLSKLKQNVNSVSCFLVTIVKNIVIIKSATFRFYIISFSCCS